MMIGSPVLHFPGMEARIKRTRCAVLDLKKGPLVLISCLMEGERKWLSLYPINLHENVVRSIKHCTILAAKVLEERGLLSVGVEAGRNFESTTESCSVFHSSPPTFHVKTGRSWRTLSQLLNLSFRAHPHVPKLILLPDMLLEKLLVLDSKLFLLFIKWLLIIARF